MPSKKHKPEEIIGKLRKVEFVLGQGGTTAEARRRIAVSEQIYYRWRKEYGGLKTLIPPVPRTQNEAGLWATNSLPEFM